MVLASQTFTQGARRGSNAHFKHGNPSRDVSTHWKSDPGGTSEGTHGKGRRHDGNQKTTRRISKMNLFTPPLLMYKATPLTDCVMGRKQYRFFFFDGSIGQQRLVSDVMFIPVQERSVEPFPLTSRTLCLAAFLSCSSAPPRDCLSFYRSPHRIQVKIGPAQRSRGTREVHQRATKKVMGRMQQN